MMKHFLSLTLIQLLVFSPAYGQAQSGSATEDILEEQKHQDFVHQDTKNQMDEACKNMEGYCGGNNPVDHDNAIDKVYSWVAKAAMSMVIGTAAKQTVEKMKEKISGGVKELFKSKKYTKKERQKIREDRQTARAEKKANKGKPKEKTEKEKGQGGGMGQICHLAAVSGVVATIATEMLLTKKSSDRFERAAHELKQTEALYSIANIHESKKKLNNIRTAIFGSVAACYTAAIFVDRNPKHAIVASAAATLSVISGISANQHKKVRDKAIKNAKSIPSSNSCHPGTPCFCNDKRELSEEYHSADFEKYCIEPELQRGDTRNLAMACLNSQGQPDLACDCLRTNSCFDSTLNQATQNMNLSPNLQNSMAETFQIIARGQVSPNQLKRINDRTKLLQKNANSIADKGFKAPILTEQQQRIAKTLNQNGLSKAASTLIATGGINQKQVKNFYNTVNKRYALSKVSRGKANRSGRSRTSNKSTQSQNNGLGGFDFFKSFQEKKQPTRELTPAERLAAYRKKRAQKRGVAMAQINPLEHKPIFNIISQRYLKSGLLKQGEN